MRQLRKTKKVVIDKVGSTSATKKKKSTTKKKSTKKDPKLKIGDKVYSKVHREDCTITNIYCNYYSLQTVARDSWIGPHTLEEIEVIK